MSITEILITFRRLNLMNACCMR